MTAKNPDERRGCGSGVPRKVPAGRVLAHNHVWHTVDFPNGANGFRCWTWPKGKVPRGFKRCGCGWAGLPHVALSEHVDWQKQGGPGTTKRLRTRG